MTEGEGSFLILTWLVGGETWLVGGDSHYDGAASINSLIACHVERRDARIIASRSRNIPRMLVVTTQIRGVLSGLPCQKLAAFQLQVLLAGSGGTMGTRNTVTRIIFGENPLNLHFW
jgi:hypothetical protein